MNRYVVLGDNATAFQEVLNILSSQNQVMRHILTHLERMDQNIMAGQEELKTELEGLASDLQDLGNDLDLTLQEAVTKNEELQTALTTLQEKFDTITADEAFDEQTITELRQALADAQQAADTTAAIDKLRASRETIGSLDSKLSQVVPPPAPEPTPEPAPDAGTDAGAGSDVTPSDGSGEDAGAATP